MKSKLSLRISDYPVLYGVSLSTIQRYRDQGVNIRDPRAVVDHIARSRQLPAGFVGSEAAVQRVYAAMHEVFMNLLKRAGISEWPPGGKPWEDPNATNAGLDLWNPEEVARHVIRQYRKTQPGN